MDSRLYPQSAGGVKARYNSSGVLIFYDASGNAIYGIDPVNRQVIYYTGTTVELNTGADLTVNADSLIDEIAALTGLSSGELGVLDGVTKGTAAANKALILGASSEIAVITTIGVTSLDVGASGTAGVLDVFPSTASKGKLTVAVTDQTGNTAVTLQVGAMGQATAVNLADPGAAASYLAQSTAALTLAEMDVLDAVTPGTAAASKAVVLGASSEIAQITTLGATNVDVGASGTAGSLDVFPATASKGKLTVAVTDQTGDTAVTMQIGAMGQATAVNLADPGVAAAYLMQSTAQITLAEADVLDGALAGTQVAAKAVVADANVNTGVSKVTELHIGATGAEVQVNATPAQLNSVAANVGVKAGTGVVAVETGFGNHKTTVFTLTNTPVVLADEAGVVAYGSLQIYDFPQGYIYMVSAVADLAVTKSSVGVNLDWDGDIGLGTTAADNDALLATTEQDILPTTTMPQAVAGATTADGVSTATEHAIHDGTSAAKDLFINMLVDDADHDVTSTPCNLILNGTITINWVFMGDN